MGGSSTAKVPAWKLRQLKQRQNGKLPSALDLNDELGGTRSSESRGRCNDELGGTRNGSSSIPAWKLRERARKERGDGFDDNSSCYSTGSTRSTASSKWKVGGRGRGPLKTSGGDDFDDSGSIVSTGSTRSTGSLYSAYSRSSVSSNTSCHPSRTIRPVSRVPGAPDPSLPPAFRAAFSKQQQRKKSGDDFLSLSSVHSRSQKDAGSTANSFGSDSFGSLDSDDDSFDGEDSFASLDSDADEDDEAYRESRNQMARLTIEKQKQSLDTKRVGKSRFKKKNIGVHGTPLDFIAE